VANTEQGIWWKHQKAQKRENSLKGRNAQEGKGSEPSQDGKEHTETVEQTAEVPAKAEKPRSKGQERRELVTATDTADVQNPEGAKDKRETGLSGNPSVVGDFVTLRMKRASLCMATDSG